MLDQTLFDEELVRLTFVVGIAVSVLVYERSHRTTGSLVVPGYIGASLLSPVTLLVTALNAILTWWLVSVQLPRVVAVFGRTLFTLNIAVSVLLSMVFGPVAGFLLPDIVPPLDSIGYVIPALIAYDMNRQGATRTATTVGFAGVLAAIPALVLVALRPAAVETTAVDVFGVAPGTVLGNLDDFWLTVAALLSVGFASVLQSGHQLRCGGFIGAMYVGLMASDVVAVGFVLVMALLTWAFVEWCLKPIMIVFGRRKFAIVLMSGSVLSWACLELAGSFLPYGSALHGLPVAALFVPALLANDMERASVLEVLVGTALAATAVLSTIVVLVGLIDLDPIPVWAVPAMLVSLLLLALPRLSETFLGTPFDPRVVAPEPSIPVAQQV